MKKLIIFVSLLFLAMAYGKAEDKEVLKIATFNLRMDTPSDGENAWFHRKDMVNDLIRFYGFDLFGTQEGFTHQLNLSLIHILENREVALNGEALFDVTKDNRHPFVVLASEVKVKVHGTCFNVNSYPKEENIRVTLFRGSVSLEAGGKEAYLYPGEIAALNKRDKTLNITSAEDVYKRQT